MKKLFFLMAVVCCSLAAVATQTIYLDANDIWDKDGAKLIVHSWGSADNDAVMTQVSGHIFKADIPDGQTGLLFKRLSPACTDFSTWCNREGYWGKTKDQTIVAGKDLCKITGWEAKEENDWCGDKTEATVGVATVEWSTYSGGTTPDPGTGGGTGLEESGEDHIFALIGSIGGDWNIQEQKTEYTFDNRGRWSGSLLSHPAKDNISYVVIMDEEGNQYKTKGWQGENATKVTLYWANGFEDSNVWQLPAGQTIYLIMRKCTFKGSIEVEKVDQATYNAYTIDWGTTPTPGTAIQHVNATLDLNAPMFDILGRQVNAQYKGIVIQNGQKYIR